MKKFFSLLALCLFNLAYCSTQIATGVTTFASASDANGNCLVIFPGSAGNYQYSYSNGGGGTIPSC